MTTIGRLYSIHYSDTFDAAHFIPGHPVEGRPHGHTWKVDISFSVFAGVNAPGADGMILDFGELKRIIKMYDHDFINENLEVPTAENLAAEFLSCVVSLLRSRNIRAQSVSVTVYESENASVTLIDVDPCT